MEGTVKWYNRKKGYGFIKGDDDVEYFIHHSAIAQGTFIRDDDRVAFEAVDSDKGKQAQNVTLLQKASERHKESAVESDEETESEEEAEPEEQQEEETEE